MRNFERKLFKKITIFLAGFFFLTFLPCQVPTDFSFYHLTSKNGISDDSQNEFVKKDSRGYVWISSTDGLNRYNGLKIKQYNSESDSLFGENIQSSLFEDGKGNMWFSTYEAIHRYSRKKNKFEYFQLNDASQNVIKSGYHVFHIQSTKNKLWLKAGNEIFCVNTENISDYKSLSYTTKGNRFAVDTSSKGDIKHIYALPWISATGIEIFSCFNDSLWNCSIYLNTPLNPSSVAPKVSYALVENDSTTWLFSEQGLLLFNRNNPQTYQRFLPKGINNLKLRKGIFWDSRHLLIPTYGNGLLLFDTHIHKYIRNWKYSNNDQNSLSSDNLLSVYKDFQNHLWISCLGSGVDHSNVKNQSFHNPIAKGDKSQIVIRSILQDSSGRFWVACRNYGIYVFTPFGELINHFSYQSLNSNLANLSEVQHLSLDKKGRIWGLSRDAIYQYKEKDASWQQILLSEKIELIFLCHTASGRKLVSTGEGMRDLKKQNGRYFLQSSQEFSKMEGANFNILFESSKGNIFIPYKGSELNVYHNNEDTLKLVQRLKIGADIFDFSESVTGDSIFVGTSNGLLLIEQTGHEFKHKFLFQETWKIGTSNVYTAIEDQNGRWWIPSNRGLWTFNPKDGKLHQYRKEDGLPDEEFSYFSNLIASDGKLWLGTSKGLAVFNPDSILPYPHAPKVQIEELLVNNTPYQGEVYIGEADSISLDYFDNTLAFELVAVGYYLPKLSTLRYRLKGYIDKWTVIKNGDNATFTKVPPGNYTLEIVAMNANGRESPLKELGVEIRPPFWQTTWFRLSMLIVIGLLIYAAVQAYIQRKLREQKILLARHTAREEERNRIAGELHDDLGAGLSIIQFLTDSVLEEEEDPDRQGQLNKVSSSARNLLEKMGDIIWALNTENDTLENLIIHLRSYSNEYLSTHNLPCEFNFPNSFPKIEFSGERRRNIVLIVKESLHNIVKHASATKVKIDIQIAPAYLEIFVIDNGKGMLKSKKKPGGRGLDNMRRRTKAMNGEIKIYSNPEEGAKIHVLIPLY